MNASKIFLTFATGASLSILFLLSGCKTGSVNTVSTTSGGQAIEQTQTDPVLADELTLVGVKQTLTASGFLVVQGQFQNQTTDKIEFYYRFRWKDDQGMVLTGLPDTWQFETVFGGSMVPVTATSKYRNASSYLIELKYAE